MTIMELSRGGGEGEYCANKCTLLIFVITLVKTITFEFYALFYIYRYIRVYVFETSKPEMDDFERKNLVLKKKYFKKIF